MRFRRVGAAVVLLLAILSVLLLILTIVLTVRSFWVADTVEWRVSVVVAEEPKTFLWQKEWRFQSNCGGLAIEVVRYNFTQGLRTESEWVWYRPPAMGYPDTGPLRRFRFLGFEWGDDKEATPSATHCLIIPLWFPNLLFSALPIIVIVRWRRRTVLNRRRASRLCLHCGYDLRATPERCPECGRAVQS